jgi:hypothetical protein
MLNHGIAVWVLERVVIEATIALRLGQVIQRNLGRSGRSEEKTSYSE